LIEGKEAMSYAAFKSKDARFDGRFFVGVRTTGIYCRPVCRARLPKAENCTYYLTAAEAYGILLKIRRNSNVLFNILFVVGRAADTGKRW
jgi:hypothetical protein